MKSRILRFVLFAMLIQLLTVHTMVSQSAASRGAVGLSCALQDNQLDFLFPLKLGQDLTIAPTLGLTSLAKTGTDLRIGIMPKLYFTGTPLSPYLGLRAAYLHLAPTNGDGASDWLLGAAGGGEYFFSDHFSVGVEAQLNCTISDQNSIRFSNPGRTNINTATAAFATIYF